MPGGARGSTLDNLGATRYYRRRANTNLHSFAATAVIIFEDNLPDGFDPTPDDDVMNNLDARVLLSTLPQAMSALFQIAVTNNWQDVMCVECKRKARAQRARAKRAQRARAKQARLSGASEASAYLLSGSLRPSTSLPSL